jgi:hypothetical protein
LISGEVTVQGVKNVMVAMGKGAWDALSGDTRWVINNYFLFDPCHGMTKTEMRELARHTIGAIEEVAVVAGAVKAASAIVKVRRAAELARGVAALETEVTATASITARTWSASGKYVAETANAIEASFPGRVQAVEQLVYRLDGSILTDFDIVLDNVVIQVKSGTGKTLTSQLIESATGTTKTVIGYTPNLNPSSALVKGCKAAGFEVFTSLDELLQFIANL